MAYDAATGNVVLFGGTARPGPLGDTWTWDGSTWTKQAPATSPPARTGASMAYDAATGTVVLFGGDGRTGPLGDTWTWDGSTWTKQAPATTRPPVLGASMAYDAATGNVVLFGGTVAQRACSRWHLDLGRLDLDQAGTRDQPARPGLASMAYDAATGNSSCSAATATPAPRRHLDLGRRDLDKAAPAPARPPGPARRWPTTRPPATSSCSAASGARWRFLGDTWTWDGSTWTKQAPATSPPSRDYASMAYDAASGSVVLFGGDGSRGFLGDTWSWGLSGEVTVSTQPARSRRTPGYAQCIAA